MTKKHCVIINGTEGAKEFLENYQCGLGDESRVLLIPLDYGARLYISQASHGWQILDLDEVINELGPRIRLDLESLCDRIVARAYRENSVCGKIAYSNIMLFRHVVNGFLSSCHLISYLHEHVSASVDFYPQRDNVEPRELSLDASMNEIDYSAAFLHWLVSGSRGVTMLSSLGGGGFKGTVEGSVNLYERVATYVRSAVSRKVCTMGDIERRHFAASSEEGVPIRIDFPGQPGRKDKKWCFFCLNDIERILPLRELELALAEMGHGVYSFQECRQAIAASVQFNRLSRFRRKIASLLVRAKLEVLVYEELLKTPLVDQSSASFEIAGFLSKVFGRNTSQLYGIWGDLVFLDSKFQFSGYFTSDADTPDVRMFLLSAAGLGRRTVSYPHGADFVPQQRHRNLAGVSLHYGELSASCAKASGIVATAFIGKPTRVRSGFGHVRQDGNSAEGGERAIVVFLSEAPFWMAPYSRVGARMVMQLLESLYSLGCERRVILKGHPMGSHSIWKSVIGQLRVGNVEYVSDPWGPREIVDNAAFAVFLSNPSTTLMNMLCEKESLGVPVVVVPFPSEDFNDLSMYGLVQPDILQAAKTIVRFLADIDADSRDQQVARLDSLNRAYFGNVEDPIKRVSFLLSML